MSSESRKMKTNILSGFSWESLDRLNKDNYLGMRSMLLFPVLVPEMFSVIFNCTSELESGERDKFKLKC